MPTLLVTGDADLYTPPSVLRMFAQRMPHAEVAIIPETGHSSYWENPAVFNATLLAFLQKH
jgi:pimeloyl-ACP methyl ester carboxylesterase